MLAPLAASKMHARRPPCKQEELSDHQKSIHIPMHDAHGARRGGAVGRLSRTCLPSKVHNHRQRLIYRLEITKPHEPGLLISRSARPHKS
eukprot:scaffold227162_cov30-Tisochrysis_lutea.AAC.1